MAPSNDDGEHFDQEYEFEAPQWIDLSREEAGNTTPPDSWFDGRMDTPMRKAAAAAAARGSDAMDQQEGETPCDTSSDELNSSGAENYLEIAMATVTPEPASEHREEGPTAAPKMMLDTNSDENTKASSKPRRILNIVKDWARNVGSPKAKRAQSGKAGKAGKAASSKRPKAPKAPKGPKPPKSSKSSKAAPVKAPKTPKAARPRVTKPITPAVMKRQSRSSFGKVILSTEEREMEEFRQKREEMVKRRKLSSSSFKRLSNSARYTPQRSEKPLTIPKEFNFDPRLEKKSQNSAKSGVHSSIKTNVGVLPSEPKKHGMVLRSAIQTSHQPKRTQPQPFKFQERLSRAKATEDSKQVAKPFVSVAQNVQKFFAATPQRFRTTARNADPSAALPSPEVLELTMPVSPKLATKARSKPSTTVSTEDQLLQEIANRQPFRARPVNGAVLNSAGDMGLPRVVPKEPTIPVNVRLNTEERALIRPAHSQETETVVHKFTARDVPDFSEIRGVPTKVPARTTRPNPPATKLTRTVFEKPEDPTVPQFKAQPLPDSQPFRPNITRKTTVPNPFKGLESRPNPIMTRQRRAQLAEEELSKKDRDFKANPMPVYEAATGIPFVRSKGTTEPEPFDLRSEALHIQRQHDIKEHEMELERELREAAKFVAKDPMQTDKPFVPRKSVAPLTEIKPFGLNLTNRMMQRKVFDKQSAAKQLQLAREEAEQQVQREAVEKRELSQFRRMIVHKAQPVRHYSDVQVQPSAKPMTQPMTPEVARRSMRARAMRA